MGDTFIHKLTHPSAEKAGIMGWYAVFQKAAEYEDELKKVTQIVYVCPEIPRTQEEIYHLARVRFARRGKGKWEYLAQLTFKN